MEILQQTQPPVHHRAKCKILGGAWFTWSTEFRNGLRTWSDYCQDLPDPPLVHVMRGEPYDYTFDLPLSRVGDPSVRDWLRRGADSLYSLNPGRQIMFLTGILGPWLEPRSMHLLIAGLRSAVADLAGEPMAALYAPLGEYGDDCKDFPLHADLYPASLLLNIFNEVSGDDSGESLFISAEGFASVLTTIRSLPHRVYERLFGCLAESSHHDRFQEFFELMYGDDNPWKNELRVALEARQTSVLFRAGEGYLLHDRRWLHGRTAPTGGVPRSRLHRLVFDSIHTRHYAPV